MKRVKDDRSFGVYLLFSIITCGIYGIFFYYYLVEDLNTVCKPMEDPDSSQESPNYIFVFIFTILTCGIYSCFWLYKQGNRIQNVGRKYGLEISENGTTLLLWPILGVLLCGVGSAVGSFVSCYYFITNINKLCRAYNRSYADNPEAIYSNSYSPAQSPVPYTASTSEFSDSCTLNFVSGELQGQHITLKDGEKITIGRDSSRCQLIIPDNSISRYHCELQYVAYERCCYITDYSTYGVYINGQRIPPNQAVKCPLGSQVSLSGGKNEFRIG